MSLSDVPFMIRNFQGINRRDGGEKVMDTEFWKIQNFYPASKGVFYKRQGSTADLSSADCYGASKVTGIWRTHNAMGELFTLYHCKPDTAIPLPQPTADLTLTEIAGGDLFAGGAVEVMRFCYTNVGFGLESNYNSRTRTGYDATKVNAWQQPGHQSITVSNNTKAVRVTAPTFQTGVKSINVFAARGTNSQMVYVGTIYASGGTLDVKCFIASNAANNDDFFNFTTGSGTPGGSLAPGVYYTALAWVCDNTSTEGDRFSGGNTIVKLAGTVTISGLQNAIVMGASALVGGISSNTSSNGAKFAYAFLGRKDSAAHPLICVGVFKLGESLTVTSLPDNCNAQTAPLRTFSSPNYSIVPYFRTETLSQNANYQDRHGFFLKKSAAGVVSEVPVSRTAYFTDGASSVLPGVIRTDADNFSSTVGYDWTTMLSKASYREPTFVSAVGLLYGVNGYTNIMQVDDKTFGFLVPRVTVATAQPPTPPVANQITNFKNQIVVAGSVCGSLIYASNTFDFNNFAAGGTGSAIRFMVVGDTSGDAVSCLGVHSFTSATDGPASRIAAFKKNRAWSVTNIPDPAAGIGASMESLSAQVGVTAEKTYVNTPIGPIFMGSDGDVYILRQGEPYKIGGKVKDLLVHLVASDSLMHKCTAVFHDQLYKLSYPSSSTSTYPDAQIWADLRTQDGDRINWYGPHIGVALGAQTTFDTEGDSGYRYGARADGLGTMRLDDPSTFQDLGSPIVSVIETKTFRHRAEMNLKRFVGALLDAYFDTAYTHSALLEFFADDQYAQNDMTLSSGAAVWDSSSFDTSKWGDAMFRAVPCWLSSNLIGRTLKFKLTHSSNAQFIIAAIGLPYRPEKRRISS